MKILFLLLLISSCSSFIRPTYFEKCHHPETGGTSIPFLGPIKNPSLRPECAPDILYSWQKGEHIDWGLFATNPLGQGKYIYSWRTPLGTYGYGDVLIRMKLRKNVTFELLEKYTKENFRCPRKNQDTTVFVLFKQRDFDGSLVVVSEYLICSVAVLESWSTSSKASYLEAKNEFDYVKKHLKDAPQSYDAFGFGFNRKHVSGDLFYIPWDAHKTKWGQDHLVRALESLKKLSPIKIFYGEGVEPSPLSHYTTNVNSYFGLSKDQLESIKD